MHMQVHGLYRPDSCEHEMHFSRVSNIDAKAGVSEDLASQFQ
jgi:hypothetical protein